MATYYKYAERDVNSQLDWSKIGKDITTMLYEQADMRRQKQDAFQNQTDELGRALEAYPTGDNLTLNEKYQNFASDGQEYRLQQDRLLKAGLLDPRDYKRSRQRFIDDTKTFFDIGKEAQTEYTKKYNRMKEGKSSFIEQDMMTMVEGLGNLQTLSPIINPATGGLNVARMVKGEDGVEIIDQKKLMGINEMRQRIKFEYDKFDKDGFVKQKSDMLGSFIKPEILEASAGGGLNVVREIMDKSLREDFDAYLDDAVQEVLTNSFNAASILGDWMSDNYTTTDDPNEAAKNDKLILATIDENGGLQITLSDKQKEAAAQYMRDQIESSIDKEIKATTSQKSYDPTRSLWINRSFEKQDKAQQFALIASARRGDKTAWQTLITKYDVSDFGFDPEKPFMSVTRGGQVKPVSLEGDAITSGSNIAAALGLNPEEYIEWAEKNNVLADAIPSETLRTNFTGIRGVKEVPKLVDEPQQQAFIRIQSGKIKGKIDPENARNSRANLQATLGSIPGMESIKVGSADSGKTITINDAEGGELLRITPSEATPTQIANFENSLAQLSYNRTLGVKDGVKIIEQITQGQLGKVVEGGIGSGDSIFEQ